MTDKVVITDIPLGDPGRGAYAYRVGDRVSQDDVLKNGWQDYVAGENTKAAQSATTTKES